MGKKNAKAKSKQDEALGALEAGTAEVFDPFIGGETDDLMDMEYVQDETTTTRVETHPPETKEEAEAFAEITDDKPEEDPEKDDSEESGSDEPEAEAEEDTEEPKEAEEESEEKADEPEGEPEALDEEPSIPKHRFDELNDRMKKAEDRAKRLEEQLEHVVEEKKVEPEPEPFDYAGKNKEAVDAILEGDTERYAVIQEEIRQATKEEAVREAEKSATEGDNRLQETMTFEEVGREIEAKYPQFVDGNEGYSAEAYGELMDLYEGYARSGKYTRIQSFKKAAEQAAKIHDLADASAPADPEEIPDNVITLQKPDVSKKAAAAKAQPPKTEGGGTSEKEPKIDPASISDEEWEALPDSTRRRLRGDVL